MASATETKASLPERIGMSYRKVKSKAQMHEGQESADVVGGMRKESGMRYAFSKKGVNLSKK